MSKPIPRNEDMELALLGSMIQTDRAIELADIMGVTTKDFYRPQHGMVFAAIKAAHEAGAVDELTVAEQLERRGELQAVGGKVALFSLTQRAPAVANAKAYAEAVVRESRLRWLVETGHAIAELGFDPGEAAVQELVNRAGELVAGVTDSTAAGDLVALDEFAMELYDEWSARHAAGGGIVGLSTGFHDLDKKTGGLQPGKLYIVAARPAMGKSALVSNILQHVVLNEGEYAAISSLEMGRKEVGARVISSMARVGGQKLTQSAPDAEDFERLFAAIQRLKAQAPGRLLIDDSASTTPYQLRAKARRAQRRLARKGARLALLAVDYLQLVDPGKDTQNENVALGFVSRELKKLAGELGIPVVALSQLSRAVEGRADKKPGLADLRGSGSLEQDADCVMFLHRPEYYWPDDPSLKGRAELDIAKQRGGETGVVHLAWLPQYTEFRSLTHPPSPAPRVHVPGGSTIGDAA